jgi:ubiquinone/menaquinone biosynthesis C-methylase UbiE
MVDWARLYFEQGYVQRWGLPPVSDQIRLEADGLSDQLRLTPRLRVVDLACGHGRHALALAQRGSEVVGVDLVLALLARAQGLAVDLGVQADWIQGDMRRLPLRSGTFDAAILIDAFGFFETEEENEAVLGEAVRVLVPGGRFGMKVVNGGTVLAAYRDTDYEERDGVVVTISRKLALEPPRMTETITISGFHGSGEYERHQRLYRVEELCGVLERAGLIDVRIFGNAAGAAFEPAASTTMWVFGQRGAQMRR